MTTKAEKDAAAIKQLRADLREANRCLRKARKLLGEALDALPDYVDGRNDKLITKIENWLTQPEEPHVGGN